MRIRYVKTRDVKDPSYGTKGSAGIDFFVPNDLDSFTVYPGNSILIPSGIKVELPDETALIAFNKSGVCTKQFLQVGACVVDSDYRGEIHLHVFNYSNQIQHVNKGQKLVQFLLLPYHQATLIPLLDADFSTTERGEGGFGSTGL
ncbi:MAG: dUTP diphosphatase [Cytophagia bacterium]|nr:dUTP diphosphatase [Cytophagia bacterium]NBW36114.1 dUTP diphosphatase [Cytophagia bacterium]